MASALRRSLSNLTCVSFKKPLFASTNVGVKQIIAPQIASRGLTLNKNFGSISSAYRGFRNLEDIKRTTSYCQRCSLQTEADGKLTQFLTDEIAAEKQSGAQPVTKVEGWDLKTDGTGVILTKKFNDEIIKVEFDVNASVNEEPVYDGDEQKGSNMVARPPFDVKVTKKSGRNLTFTCEFNEPEPSFEEGEGQEEDIEDQFNIIDVILDEPGKQDDLEKFYSINSSVMDGTLYDLLMDMLDERGIDDTFINNMVDFATWYEHKMYIEFLEKLDSVIKED